MFSWRDAGALLLALAVLLPPAAAQARFGFGRAPAPAELAAWDIDVRPDGHGVRVGRGTVEQGQEIYDAKCATCHGTFGESNQYMVIAGGVRAEDLRAGRAAGLRSAEVVRTLGNKLNYATTLWDYINRAMPWSAPQSLSVDQVYAVTAYVLFLNEIVPAEFELNNENLLTLKMPNRDGLTRRHGMGRVDAKPDVQGLACMTRCAAEPKIVSEMPAFALNAHGDLRRQFRPIGALATIDSTRHEGHNAGLPVAQAMRSESDGNTREILTRNACMTCHGFDSAVVGPAFKDVAARYRERAEATNYLVEKIRKGGVGAWGQVPMPGQPGIREDELVAVVRWLITGSHRTP
jgi:cytochrome c